MPIVLQEKESLTTKTVYQTLLKVKLGALTKAHLIVTNSHGANAIQYRISESNDDKGVAGSFHSSTAQTDILANATKQHTYDPAPLWIHVEVHTKTGSNHGTANAWLKGVGL